MSRQCVAPMQETVVVATFEPDPYWSGKQALCVGGNVITFTLDTLRHQINLIADGQPQGEFAPSGYLIAYGGSGSNLISVARNITEGAILFGGPGTNLLLGGGGETFMFAGTGTNSLFCSRGNWCW